MAPAVESQYKDLLNPVKDPEKSFAINISELLQSFVSDLVEGRTTPNFNSAALLLQGSASIYGKKVEYLHNLATQLHNNLLKQKKGDQQQPKKETKEKEKKVDKINDPFLSIEIKVGKNLSCLRKKNTSKATSKKPAKKSKSASIPVNLLSADIEEKGEVFYDTRGEIVGNQGDYALNKCRLISSGWLLLPTVNPKLVPFLGAVPDYYDDSSELHEQDLDDINEEELVNECFDDGLQSSPDEGFGSYPASNATQASSATGVNSEQNTITPSQATSVPPSTDEGMGSTPNEVCPSPGIENVPTDCEAGVNANQAPMPVRQTVRQALKTCQLALEDDPLAGVTIDKELLVRKKIAKKNTRRLPNKLKLLPGEEEIVCSISDYCARTFFAIDGKILKNSLLSFDVDSFDQNSRFMKKIMDKIDALKSSDRLNKEIDPIEDEREIDVDGIECLKDADEDDETLCIPFDDNDIQIDNDPVVRDSAEPAERPAAEDLADIGPDVSPDDLPSLDLSHIAHEECANYKKEVHEFVQNSDITERVHAWEKDVKPFLDALEEREIFDINLYGSRILNAFEDNNSKQTMTFRQFCKDKEKWEVHRYFMALLPLANIGNVSIESEHKEDGTEEIFVTLLSRKMHHKELEEFGHSEGSHS